MKKRIFKQQAIPIFYKDYLNIEKEQLKQELIKAIQDTPIDELVNVEERELYYFITINVYFYE